VVSFATDEAWDALLGVKTAEAATAVAGGGALCVLLCSIQVTVGVSSIQMKNSLISPFNLQSNVVTSISLTPNLTPRGLGVRTLFKAVAEPSRPGRRLSPLRAAGTSPPLRRRTCTTGVASPNSSPRGGIRAVRHHREDRYAETRP
jgi:hypothetical protein